MSQSELFQSQIVPDLEFCHSRRSGGVRVGMELDLYRFIYILKFWQSQSCFRVGILSKLYRSQRWVGNYLYHCQSCLKSQNCARVGLGENQNRKI